MKYYANCGLIAILSLILFLSVLGWVEPAKAQATARGVITFDFPIPLKPQIKSILGWVGTGKTQEAAGGIVTFNDRTLIKPTVEVNLDSELIAFVAKTTKQEPEIAELIAMLEGVYIRSYAGDTVVDCPFIWGRFPRLLSEGRFSDLVTMATRGVPPLPETDCNQ